jgi:MoxR-like ATPase
MDRFMMRISIGYPDRDAEKDILRVGSQKYSIERIEPLLLPSEIVSLQRTIESGTVVSEKIIEYILTIAEMTRNHPQIVSGISTRGAMVLLSGARCAAWMQGRDFVIPEDVKIFASDVLVHRMHMKGSPRTDAPGAGEVLRMILSEVPALK